MKNSYKATLLIALGLASVSAVRAQTSDLLLGFNDAAGPSTAQNDYVIDLGLTGNALIADATANNGTYNLSSTFSASTFNTAFGTDSGALSDVAAGVVGGVAGVPTAYLFQTSLVGNSPTTLASSATPAFNNSLASAGASTIGEYGSGGQSGWTAFVAASPSSLGTLTSGSDVSAQTGNPLGQLSSGVLDLTLWENTETKAGTHEAVQGWVDEGTIDINLNNDTIGFSTVAVPEPSTYGLFAGAGLLAVALRRQFSVKNS